MSKKINSVNAGEPMSYSTDGVRNLYEVVCEVLNRQHLGFQVMPDKIAKQFVFCVYEGEVNLCMFSPSNRTAYDVEYSVEKQDAATNSGWYERRYTDMGDWDANSNTPSLYNNQSSNAYTFYIITSDSYKSNGEKVEQFGLWCRKGQYICCDNAQGTWKIVKSRPNTIWMYIDNSSKSGLQKWDVVLSGIKTPDEAKSEISQRTICRDTSCEAYGMEYGKDYKLGDIVRVQLEFGDFKRTEQKRVSSVIICYDVDKSGVIPKLSNVEE